jgi:hypothetical protein
MELVEALVDVENLIERVDTIRPLPRLLDGFDVFCFRNRRA